VKTIVKLSITDGQINKTAIVAAIDDLLIMPLRYINYYMKRKFKNILIFGICVSVFVLLFSCAKDPYNTYECSYPCFIDNSKYAFAQIYRRQSLGLWGDPSLIETSTSVKIVNLISNDTITVVDGASYSWFKYLSFNYLDTILTVAADDSLIVFNLDGRIRSKYQGYLNAKEFRGWYDSNSLFASMQTWPYIGVYLSRINNVDGTFIANARNANATIGKIVFWHDNSAHLYSDSTLFKLPFIANFITFSNDTVLAFSRRNNSPVFLYNINTEEQLNIGNLELGYEPEFDVSPDMKIIAYKDWIDGENAKISVINSEGIF
jgi:hypothetical protein